MLQLQYYNSVLKNNHIGKILNNYKLKYSRLVNEIESKINEMMKLCLKDILSFLENLEEAADQKRKINDYDKIKRELELVKQKLKSKNYYEHKLKSDFELLQQENNVLKLKINSLNQKISNLRNLNISISQNSSISQEKNYTSRNNQTIPKSTKSVMTPKSEKKNNLYIALNSTSTEENISSNKSSILDLINSKSKIIKTDKSFKNNDKKKLNKNNNQKKKIINAKKFINNNAAAKAYKNISKNIKVNINPIISMKKIHKRKNNYYSPRPTNSIKKIDFRNKKNSRNKNKKKNNSLDLELNNENNYNPLNTFNLSADVINVNPNINYEDLGKNIYEAFDSELKELEQDEANIELLLEQLSDDDDNGDGNEI
jgi:hypothetical protein